MGHLASVIAFYAGTGIHRAPVNRESDRDRDSGSDGVCDSDSNNDSDSVLSKDSGLGNICKGTRREIS